MNEQLRRRVVKMLRDRFPYRVEPEHIERVLDRAILAHPPYTNENPRRRWYRRRQIVRDAVACIITEIIRGD